MPNEREVNAMSEKCDTCSEHTLESKCARDFRYELISLTRPDGSIMHALQMVDLPIGEKGEISKFLEKQGAKQ